jgi:acyl-CoA synthetase (NDP forming)
LQTLIECDACDAILTIFVTSLVTTAAEVATAIRSAAAERRGVPIAAVFMTAEGPPTELAEDGVRVPGYEFPENAVRAVALAAQHGCWRATPDAPAPDLPDARPDAAAAIISAGLARGPGWLPMPAVHELLACYGLPLVPTRFAEDAEGAARAASELGPPVVLKATAEGIVHKTEAGAVRLGLRDGDEVRAAAADIEATVADAGHRVAEFVVQPMVGEGVELIVGVVSDPSFGPVLACGAGGTTAELQRDISVRITPLSARDPIEMLRALRSYPLLQGYRGHPPADVAAVEDVLLRISAMVKTHPEIVELDCNPVIARPDGAVIVDARVRVQSAPLPQPLASVRT